MLDKKIKAAVNVIDEVCAKFQGTLKDHQVIQEAIQIIRGALNPEKTKAKSTKGK